jgi:hypothetical protein
MNTRAFNFGLMLFWLVLGVGLITRSWWMENDWKARVEGANPQLMIGFVFLMAAWNFIRMWSVAQRQPVYKESQEASEIRRRIREKMGGEDPKITDPQFNFDEPSSGASTTGETP